jgi:8-oxo-dGTP pyrophosphatase MutT (NUDIX family)
MAPRSPPNFDPRAVPVVRVDSHLPAVSTDRMVPAALRSRFREPPDWTPELRSENPRSNRLNAYASVLIPIVLRRLPTVLLTQRADHLSSHAGQIAFPGGKADMSDADSIATALREAQEEVGLPPHRVEVLGTLPEYITSSSFVVTPVVALVPPELHWIAAPNEVAKVFEVPLDYLMSPANHRHHELEWDGASRHWLSMPYVDSQTEWFIWGATAGMLRNLYRFLSA